MGKDPSPRKRRNANAGEKLVASIVDFFPVNKVHKDKVQRDS